MFLLEMLRRLTGLRYVKQYITSCTFMQAGVWIAYHVSGTTRGALWEVALGDLISQWGTHEVSPRGDWKGMGAMEWLSDHMSLGALRGGFAERQHLNENEDKGKQLGRGNPCGNAKPKN